MAGEGTGWVLHTKYSTMCEPFTSSQGSQRLEGTGCISSIPWGRSCWPWLPPVLAVCTDFKKALWAAPTPPPSPELDCSSLVTLLLNNLQNGALPAFIGEAFQVCAADFCAFLVQLPGGGSCLSLSCCRRHLPERKRPLHVHRDPRRNQGENPCVPRPVGVLQAPCYTGALGKGHSHSGLERRCLGFVSVSFSW